MMSLAQVTGLGGKAGRDSKAALFAHKLRRCSAGRVLAEEAQSPGFQPQRHINGAW